MELPHQLMEQSAVVQEVYENLLKNISNVVSSKTCNNINVSYLRIYNLNCRIFCFLFGRHLI